jgi:integrase
VDEYATLLATAKKLDPMWYAACCLAGEAGLRLGEIRALDWRRDVDLIAGNDHGEQADAARRVDIAEGADAAHGAYDRDAGRCTQGARDDPHRFRDPEPRRRRDDRQRDQVPPLPALPCCGATRARLAHNRHGFGTHAAMFGVNPWKLMTWMGHKRIDETMLYVHFAEAHLRPPPEPILSAQRGYDDPDKKVIAMSAARTNCVQRGSGVAVTGLVPKITL